MPSVLKQQGLFPLVNSVCIPDVAPAEPKRPPAKLPEACAPDGQTAPAESDEVLPEKMPAPQPFDYTPAYMTRGELSEYYREELEELRLETVQAARAQALAEKRAEIAGCIEKVDRQLQSMQTLQQDYMTRYARELKDMAVDIAEKLILTHIDENEETLVKLVISTVHGIKNADWLSVEVSDQLSSLVETLKRELEKPEYRGKVTVEPVPAPADTCRIITEAGTAVATVSVQAENLRETFRAAEREQADGRSLREERC